MKLVQIVIICLFVSPLWASELALIATSGKAEKSIEPNMVILQIEAYGKDATAKLAQEKQAREYQRLKAAVEKFKIKKDDFSTENLSMNQEYNYDQKTQVNKIVGYRVSHSIKIIVRQKNDVGQLIDSLSSNQKVDSSGVNISQIQWDNDSKQTQNASLINEAVADAKKKAEQLASAAGVKIKGIQSIQFGSIQADAPIRERMYMSKSLSADAGGGTEVSGGQIKIRVEVSMQFRID